VRGNRGLAAGPAAGYDGRDMPTRAFRISRQFIIGLTAIGVALIWNPSRLDSRDKQLAKALFRSNCAACHGIDGHGDGPDAVNVSFPMPDLMVKKLKNGNGFGQIRHVIADGKQEHGMPAHRGKMRSIELDLVTWELVRLRKAFARHLLGGGACRRVTSPRLGGPMRHRPGRAFRSANRASPPPGSPRQASARRATLLHAVCASPSCEPTVSGR